MPVATGGTKRGCAALCGVLFAALLSAAAPVAFAVQIDGYDDDWSTWDTRHDDPNESGQPDYWDLQTTLFKHDPANDMFYFYWRTYSSTYYGSNDDSAILIDADCDSSTGGSVAEMSGLEYALYWDLGDPSSDRVTGLASFYVWNDDTDRWEASGTYPVARGRTSSYVFVEWSLPTSEISVDSFNWCAGYEAIWVIWRFVDYSPDAVTQVGCVPEPGTLGLTALSLLSLAAALARRRRLQ